MASDVAARLADVRARIARAAAVAHRDPMAVSLVAVSKTFGAEAVRAAAAAGQIDFGENKVQEASGKIDAVGRAGLRWHLVGHLQSNKARKAGALFDVIHSVDGPAVVRKIDEGAVETGRRVELLVQVDLAGETTKFGARETELPDIFAAASGLRGVQMIGLMILPPIAEDPDQARPYFRELRGVRDRLIRHGVPEGMLRQLSMGMSHDFEAAVEEGATIVRVGTAIFGARGYPAAPVEEGSIGR